MITANLLKASAWRPQGLLYYVLRNLRISHVEFDFQARRKKAQAGIIEWNGIFGLFWFSKILGHATSWGTPKISGWNPRKCLFHLLPHPKFPEVLVEWKTPWEFISREICLLDVFESTKDLVTKKWAAFYKRNYGLTTKLMWVISGGFVDILCNCTIFFQDLQSWSDVTTEVCVHETVFSKVQNL